MKDRLQKIIVLDIDANTQTFLEGKIGDGYIIYSITNLTPIFEKLLIVYYDPPEEI